MQIKKVSLLLIALCLYGCSARHNDLDKAVKSLTVPERSLLTITNGESFETITNAFGIAARLEFTFKETNVNSYTLISCYFAGGDDALWLVFRDKTLLKIIKPVSFPELLESYPYQGTTATRIKSWDIDDSDIEFRIKRVIDTPALTRSEIENILNDSHSGTASGSAWNIIPASLMSGTLAKETPLIEKDYKTNENLLERYNGCLASVGMDKNAVEALYGKPLRIITTKGGETARIYGYEGTKELQVNPQLVFRGLAIVSNAKGQVTAVYSGAFFCDEWGKPN